MSHKLTPAQRALLERLARGTHHYEGMGPPDRRILQRLIDLGVIPGDGDNVNLVAWAMLALAPPGTHSHTPGEGGFTICNRRVSAWDVVLEFRAPPTCPECRKRGNR